MLRYHGIMNSTVFNNNIQFITKSHIFTYVIKTMNDVVDNRVFKCVSSGKHCKKGQTERKNKLQWNGRTVA